MSGRGRGWGIGGVVGALTGVLDDEVLVAPHVVDALRRRPELVRPQPAPPTHTPLSHNRRPPRRASARGRCRRPNSAAMHAPSASRRRRKRAERKEQSRAMEGGGGSTPGQRSVGRRVRQAPTRAAAADSPAKTIRKRRVRTKRPKRGKGRRGTAAGRTRARGRRRGRGCRGGSMTPTTPPPSCAARS